MPRADGQCTEALQILAKLSHVACTLRAHVMESGRLAFVGFLLFGFSLEGFRGALLKQTSPQGQVAPRALLEWGGRPYSLKGPKFQACDPEEPTITHTSSIVGRVLPM